MKVNFVNLKAQYQTYKKEIDSVIADVIDNNQFILGSYVEQFQNQLQDFTGCAHAITCANGTDALQLCLMALDIGPGDEVITSPFTFIATAEVISLTGATPVFVDIDEQTYNINSSLIEQAITPKTKAIIPASLFGQCADMDIINQIALKNKITVIEDACQSFGATFNNKKSCNLSALAATSFFPSKPLGCFGDGGAVFTNDRRLADKIISLRNHGQGERYVHKYIGLNSRLDNLQAAVLSVKMKHFEKECKDRINIAGRYTELLQNSSFILPAIRDDRTSIFAQYSLRSRQRELTIKKLNEAGIPTAIHYPIPLYKQEAFKGLNLNPADFQISEMVTKEIFSIPMSAFLTEKEQDETVTALQSIAGV